MIFQSNFISKNNSNKLYQLENKYVRSSEYSWSAVFTSFGPGQMQIVVFGLTSGIKGVRVTSELTLDHRCTQTLAPRCSFILQPRNSIHILKIPHYCGQGKSSSNWANQIHLVTNYPSFSSGPTAGRSILTDYNGPQEIHSSAQVSPYGEHRTGGGDQRSACIWRYF